MKNNRRNKKLVKQCLLRYVEESNAEIISKHFYWESAFMGDILVSCHFKTHGPFGIQSSITLSGKSLCERYGVKYDE